MKFNDKAAVKADARTTGGITAACHHVISAALLTM
jgi:hypothetical protein